MLLHLDLLGHRSLCVPDNIEKDDATKPGSAVSFHVSYQGETDAALLLQHLHRLFEAAPHAVKGGREHADLILAAL